jgi:hypothetical protein
MESFKDYGAFAANSTGAVACRCRADGLVAILAAQIVDPFVKPFQRLAPFKIEKWLLPAAVLQRAGAHAEQPHGASAQDVLPQERADGFENLLIETGR